MDKGVPKDIAAEILGISVIEMDHWIDQDRISTIHYRDHILIDAEELESLIIEIQKLQKVGRQCSCGT